MFAALAIAASTALAPQEPPAVKLWLEGRDGSLRARSAEGLDVAGLAELGAISVRFEGFSAPPPPKEAQALWAEVRLDGGDVLYGAVRGGSGERLALEFGGGARLEIDAERLVSLAFSGRTERPALQGLEAPSKGDRLYWLRPSGLDRVDGTLEEFSAQGVAFDSQLGRRVFPWAEVAALFVEPLGPSRDAAAGGAARVCVDLADGGRLHAELARLEAGGVRLRWGGASSLQLPLGAVAELCADDGSLAYLSSLAPVSVREGWPPDDELGLKWPFRVDRAVTGEPLRAAGRVWSRGLGVHAPSRLEWALDGRWSALRGAVAIDDSVLLLPYRGSVEFSIYLDGRAEPAWKSGRVRGGDAPLPLPPLALGGVQRLALVVEMDERSYVADRGDWLRMLLLR